MTRSYAFIIDAAHRRSWEPDVEILRYSLNELEQTYPKKNVEELLKTGQTRVGRVRIVDAVAAARHFANLA